jgi:pantetheine-phosphate adenylyltransferase
VQSVAATKLKRRIGMYPGTFDPITNGHMDIIKRSTKLVDKLVIGVAVNAGKGPLFTLDERVAMVRHECATADTNGAEVEVRPFSNLLMQFAEQVDATMIVRGLRAVTDFDYEFQMTSMNARLNNRIETVFLMASESNSFIASRLVKEIAFLNGEIKSFLSSYVADLLLKRVRSVSNTGTGG